MISPKPKIIFYITLLLIVCLTSYYQGIKNAENNVQLTTKNADKTKITRAFESKLIAPFCAYNIVQLQDSAFHNNGMEWTEPKANPNNMFLQLRTIATFLQLN